MTLYRKIKLWIVEKLSDKREWYSMDTAPRDGTVIEMRLGRDAYSVAWWDMQISPIQYPDGTWPREQYGHPWAFVDCNNNRYFINHVTDKPLYGPSQWRPYQELTP